jgi:hypothetical protein
VRFARALAACALVAGCGRLRFASEPGDAHDPDATPGELPVDRCAGRLFCAWFDTGLDEWDGYAGVGEISHDRVSGHTPGAMRASAPVGSSGMLMHKAVPAGGASLWLRAFVFAPSGQTLDGEPLALTDAGELSLLVFSLYDDGYDVHSHGLMANYSISTSATVPRDRWACFELHVELGAAGRVELFVDGARVIGQDLGIQSATPLDRLEAGIVSKPTSRVETLSIDDVVYDDQPIGCD